MLLCFDDDIFALSANLSAKNVIIEVVKWQADASVSIA